jgi:hypothetical protein
MALIEMETIEDAIAALVVMKMKISIFYSLFILIYLEHS